MRSAKPFSCTLCPKSFHTAEAKNEHTQLRHQNQIIDPETHNPGEWTQRVVVKGSALDEESD